MSVIYSRSFKPISLSFKSFPIHLQRLALKSLTRFGRGEIVNCTYRFCPCSRIVRFPWQLREDKVRRVFKEALKIWSDVTPLTFTEIQSGKADIRIDFTRYWHGDNLPFDGPGGILAHAFFPKTHRQGDIHFDYDETWTLGNHMGTDLLQVAAHEFGHVLGLQHSREPGASSICTGPGPEPTRPLPRLLPSAASSTTTTAASRDQRDPDTREYSQTAHQGIKCKDVFSFTVTGLGRTAGTPIRPGNRPLAPGCHRHRRRAFEDKSATSWFFQGQYWVFDAQMQQRGPEPLSSLGLSVPSVQAVLRWGSESSYNTFLFRGGSYWRFSPKEGRAQGPLSMGHWSGVPNQVDCAFRDIYGYAHFTRGRQYWKLDPAGMNSLEGYPRLIGVDFFGCRNM
uniref:Matrix metallopeptidase 11 n=1 Tax=Neogobius melanostomus TaxID=47308 RepID=A0A8C6SL83_9GOBI